jgi:signal transduction histidine kinase
VFDFLIFLISFLILAYSDTGIGLSATEIDLLFVPFQQADVGKFILYLAIN